VRSGGNGPIMDNTNRMFFEAIALKRCIVAIYNRMRVKLAPHILYTKHGDMFVDAVTLERDGQPPREIKLGTFKLAGLKDPDLVEDGFQPEALFNPADEKYAGVTLFAVEPA
jgi:hypothetical protein